MRCRTELQWPSHCEAACRSTSRAFTASTIRQASDALEPSEPLSDAERQIFDKLKAELSPEKLEVHKRRATPRSRTQRADLQQVKDISGGCGSMYAFDIVSSKFSGLTMVKQHKMVNRIMADEIKGWHGVQLVTKAP